MHGHPNQLRLMAGQIRLIHLNGKGNQTSTWFILQTFH